MALQVNLKSEWLDATKVFAFPDWPKIHQWIEDSFPSSEHGQVHDVIVRDWLRQVAAGFSCEMEVGESEHFFVVTSRAAGNTRATLVQLEDYRNQIISSLAELNLMEWSRKVAVIVAPDQDAFTRYLSDYYSDGEYMLPGGVCLRQGCVHFVLPDSNLVTSAPVLAHELTHVCVTGIDWPLWVEEAVVQAIEHKLSQRKPYVLDREMAGRHRKFWNRENIQDFWSGYSFHYPNEGSELSYHLCRFLLESVAQEGRNQLLAFLRQARRSDAGYKAMWDVLGVFPCEILTDFLGEGDWALKESLDDK